MNNEWRNPVRVREDGLLITIATAAQARSWLQHKPRGGRVWQDAITKCTAASQGRISNDEARLAFIKAAH
jgi:hypothetical protein